MVLGRSENGTFWVHTSRKLPIAKALMGELVFSDSSEKDVNIELTEGCNPPRCPVKLNIVCVVAKAWERIYFVINSEEIFSKTCI